MTTLINQINFPSDLKKKILLKLKKHGKNKKGLLETIDFITKRNY